MGFLSVSVDLDEIDCYAAIHGISPDSIGGTKNVIYQNAIPRAANFFKELGIKATFFVVGKDLSQSSAARSQIGSLADDGHEIGNHTMSHRYDFSVLSQGEQENEIDQASDEIKRACGKAPIGFRAPGYNVNRGNLGLLEKKGYHYDSSVFPCPAYYAAKAGAIGIKAVQGHRSASLVGDPRVITAPVLPYRVADDDLFARGNGLPELPITVVTKARLPFIGTSVAAMGALPAKLFAKQAAKLPFVNLELHGIDYIDADGDGIAYLKPHQPDIRIPLTKRRKSLVSAIQTLLNAGLEPVTLQQAVSRILI